MTGHHSDHFLLQRGAQWLLIQCILLCTSWIEAHRRRGRLRLALTITCLLRGRASAEKYCCNPEKRMVGRKQLGYTSIFGHIHTCPGPCAAFYLRQVFCHDLWCFIQQFLFSHLISGTFIMIFAAFFPHCIRVLHFTNNCMFFYCNFSLEVVILYTTSPFFPWLKNPVSVSACSVNQLTE